MLRSVLGGVALCALATAASAASYSFNGTFASDDEVQLFTFTVGATSNVTLKSFSYAGGTQADGTVVEAGGFDPILALFDGSGGLVAQQDDADAGVPEDPTTSSAFDVLYSVLLDAGRYTVSIQQYNNFAAGSSLSDGFTQQGNGNFTGAAYNCSAGSFCDVDGYNRSNAWAFDILNVDLATQEPNQPAPVPLPAGLPLLATALGLFCLRRRG